MSSIQELMKSFLGNVYDLASAAAKANGLKVFAGVYASQCQ
jgi:hypothetical protein